MDPRLQADDTSLRPLKYETQAPHYEPRYGDNHQNVKEVGKVAYRTPEDLLQWIPNPDQHLVGVLLGGGDLSENQQERTSGNNNLHTGVD